ncbi:hypothetical protein KY321_00480 [Candidatus Woesearchaeota archaeon]|nr:hypothetical protein [Candidatus Woesearchaeota archaeon]
MNELMNETMGIFQLKCLDDVVSIRELEDEKNKLLQLALSEKKLLKSRFEKVEFKAKLSDRIDCYFTINKHYDIIVDKIETSYLKNVGRILGIEY